MDNIDLAKDAISTGIDLVTGNIIGAIPPVVGIIQALATTHGISEDEITVYVDNLSGTDIDRLCGLDDQALLLEFKAFKPS